jgi:tetratricopeptide (TPR) repeat protein
MKRPLGPWFTGLLLLFCAGVAGAKPDLPAATAAFRAGNAAYEQGRYEEAAAAYAKAEAAGAADARLYYNQGNALFRLNRLGGAILAYERARKLAPADPDIEFNLRFARSRIVDKTPEPALNAFSQALWNLHAGYSLRSGVWAAFALFALGFAALAGGLFAGSAGRIAAFGISLLAFCALLAFSPSLWLRVRHQETAGRAVVLEPVAELYSGPGEKYELLFRAHEGTAFDIVERRGEWLSVKLPDGKGGFIRARKTGEV